MTSKTIDIASIHRFITEELDGVVPQNTWGERAYFYNPGGVLKRGTYFTTIKEKDGENDRASDLNRDGFWRLNMGIHRATFLDLFGSPPTRPGKGETIEGPWDFTDTDVLMPHPVYGWMSWVAIVSPGEATFEQCKTLISDAHARAVETFKKRTNK